jgi:hypothetical protein
MEIGPIGASLIGALFGLVFIRVGGSKLLRKKPLRARGVTVDAEIVDAFRISSDHGVTYVVRYTTVRGEPREEQFEMTRREAKVTPFQVVYNPGQPGLVMSTRQLAAGSKLSWMFLIAGGFFLASAVVLLLEA